jgi:hypothetical protein
MDNDMKSFNKVVIWGWKLHSHTHSYIHYGFYKAFKHLGYDTLWLDNADNVSGINFDNCLFLTEGQVDQNIPKNATSKYILHNCDGARYIDIDLRNRMCLQFFSKDVFKYRLARINDYTYTAHDALYQPWATDLLPNEFNENDAHNEMNNRECIWVGSYSPEDHTAFQNNTELDPFFNECKKNGIRVRVVDPWVKPCSPEENRTLVHNAFAAPAINGIHQKNTFYIPCRIFKNISYGHFGITNNEHVNTIFDGKLIYDTDPAALFHKMMAKKNSPTMIEELKYLINEVRTKHTYINRANSILEFLETL